MDTDKTAASVEHDQSESRSPACWTAPDGPFLAHGPVRPAPPPASPVVAATNAGQDREAVTMPQHRTDRLVASMVTTAELDLAALTAGEVRADALTSLLDKPPSGS